MTAYKGMSRHLKDALITILQGIKYDVGNGPEAAFTNVIDNTDNSFESSPTVEVLPETITSVSALTAEKDHTVGFIVRMIWNLQDSSTTESQKFNQAYDLVDLIINTVEHGDYIGQLSTIDPTIQSWLMDVKQAKGWIASGKAGALLIWQVNIIISYSQYTN
jgi:hypothetical protein